MTINTAQIVYVVAPSGTGKSFTGDYLAVVHGFEHVDGDWPLKHSNIPENAELSRNTMIPLLTSGGFKEDEKHLWGGYFEKIANMTVEAAQTHDRVVLSHATYDQLPRDVVIETLLNSGIKKEQITVIQLTIDKAVLTAGIYERFKRQAGQIGMTFTEAFGPIADPRMEWEGEITKETYVNFYVSVADPFGCFADDPAAIKVDVSSRGVAHFDGIDTALGLTRDNSLSYEEICKKVLPLDAKRDEEAIACGGFKVMCEIATEAEAISKACELESKEKEQDEAELAKMKRRRSSLKDLKDQMDKLRMMSTRNLEEVLEE
eukprot:CAMPEP_0181078866 /NCGR_PEP_ID=MMETSP1071-20121207/1717_1 /TAXON_ID=35127 /ORGANISM="Thalassiosira sp., Strain NH16" /LENGTH=317 /DNA_ID=CAMNT_0023160215 /DNA_START=183 /DNA_END=1136 /DNA_ORIENTATION=+